MEWRLQLMDALSAVRSERILASLMHTPVTPNLQSPNKISSNQIGRVQTHFKIKIATPGESGHSASLREAALRIALRSCLPAARLGVPRTSELAWRGNNWFDLRGNGGREPISWRRIYAEKPIFRQ